MSEDLVWSLKNGDMNEVQKIVEKPGFDVNAIVKGRTALHFAADYGQTEVIAYLLEKGADINKQDIHGITPLLAAVWESHTEAVRKLLEKGATKDGKAPDGNSYYSCAETDDIKQLLS